MPGRGWVTRTPVIWPCSAGTNGRGPGRLANLAGRHHYYRGGLARWGGPGPRRQLIHCLSMMSSSRFSQCKDIRPWLLVAGRWSQVAGRPAGGRRDRKYCSVLTPYTSSGPRSPAAVIPAATAHAFTSLFQLGRRTAFTGGMESQLYNFLRLLGQIVGRLHSTGAWPSPKGAGHCLRDESIGFAAASGDWCLAGRGQIRPRLADCLGLRIFLSPHLAMVSSSLCEVGNPDG